MKQRITYCGLLLILIVSCTNPTSTEERLEKSFTSLIDSLENKGYSLHQQIDPSYYPKSFSETKIEGNLGYSYTAISDTVFIPKTVSIKGNSFKKNGLVVEYYQFYFADKNEETEFNQFIPFSQFLLSNNKTPGTYFMHESFLYLEHHPFP